jgi:GTP-binding protein
MKPVIALLGRPNVGKSTLFNRITGSRDAIVVDVPGVTRDRQYGRGRLGEVDYYVVDTGGVTDRYSEQKNRPSRSLEEHLQDQTRNAIVEADAVIFVVDARDGILPADRELAADLRKLSKPVVVAVNKAEGLVSESAQADFFALGFENIHVISAKRGDGVQAMIDEILAQFPQAEIKVDEQEEQGIRVSIVGRPNAGKSTLINSIFGEERVVVSDQPGTTRDSILIPFDYRGKHYQIFDTAGVRRRSKVKETIEKFSVVKTLQAIEQCNVVVLVIDGVEGLSEQDATLAGIIVEEGKALVIAVNKLDKLDKDRIEWLKQEIDRRFPFLGFAHIHFISAKESTGVSGIFRSIDKAYESACKTLPTSKLNRELAKAVEKTAPPMVHGRRIKLKFAHQGGKNPPRIIIHGNQVESVPDSYRRYLSNTFRKVFRLEGTPVAIEFRSGDNPFAGKKSTKKKLKSRTKR